MRALADYVMKGRTQAVLVAALTTGSVLFAWVGAAVVALVTLRKGTAQGGQILLWAMIPGVVLAAMGDTGPVTSLLGVMFASVVLRELASWPFALLAATVSGIVTSVLMVTIGQGYIEEILRLLTETVAQMAVQGSDTSELQAAIPSATQIAGLLGLSNAFVVVISLILARWWQSLLYNPGGFSTEFKGLRLSPQLTVMLLVVGLTISMFGTDYRLWALIFALPIMFSGIALVHSLAEKRQINSNWLVVFYISFLLLDPVKLVLLVVAIVDSWFNIRNRVASR
jgi:hypothetical protein